MILVIIIPPNPQQIGPGTVFASILRCQPMGYRMKHRDLLKKVAQLETINDQLTAELHYLDDLTRALGFAEGLKTLKSAALEMLEADKKGIKSEDEANPPLSS